MNKFIVIAFLSALGTQSFSQTRGEISTFLGQYEDLMKDRQWSKSLDYVYPALFDVAPRSMMEEAISKTFNDTSQFRIGIEGVSLKDVGEAHKEEDLSYTFATYDLVMSMKRTDNPTEREMEAFESAMATQFGAENVNFKGQTLYITTNNRMAVLRKAGEQRMYMLEIKPELKAIMQTFMSEEFMQKAFEK